MFRGVLLVLWLVGWWSLPMLAVHFGGRAINFIGLLGCVAFGATLVAALWIGGHR